MKTNDKRICVSKRLLCSISFFIFSILLSLYFFLIKKNYVIATSLFGILTSFNIGVFGICPKTWSSTIYHIIKYTFITVLIIISIVIIIIF